MDWLEGFAWGFPTGIVVGMVIVAATAANRSRKLERDRELIERLREQKGQTSPWAKTLRP